MVMVVVAATVVVVALVVVVVVVAVDCAVVTVVLVVGVGRVLVRLGQVKRLARRERPLLRLVRLMWLVGLVTPREVLLMWVDPGPKFVLQQ